MESEDVKRLKDSDFSFLLLFKRGGTCANHQVKQKAAKF